MRPVSSARSPTESGDALSEARYGVQMVKVGESDIPGPELFWMSEWERWFRLDFLVGVIRGHGVTAIVNTGPPSDLSAMNQKWVSVLGENASMRREAEWWILNQLERLGVAPSEVTHVIVTPFQLYSIANVAEFPSAQICVSKKGWIHYHTTHRHPHDDRWFCIPRDVLQYLTIDAWERVRLLEDEDEVVPGIRTWWAGSHHRATIAVEVDSTDGTVVMTDAFFSYRNLEDNHPIGVCENIHEALAAHERTRQRADHAVPLYDPLVLERYPDGVVAELPTS